MILTLKQKKEIKSLVKLVCMGIEFLVEQCEHDDQYLYGVRHLISQQIASILSESFGKDSSDCDTVGRYMKLYGVEDKIESRISEEEIENRILSYVNSEDFKNL